LSEKANLTEREELERYIGECVLDRSKRMEFLEKASVKGLDEESFSQIRDYLEIIDSIYLIERQKHFKPISMDPVIRHAIPPSAERYFSFLRFVENRRAIIVQYTKKCNLECAHCIVDCSPEREERMDRNLLRDIILDGFDKGYRKLMFTGGEPLIYGNELIEDLNFAKSIGFISSIGTNAYWANTRQETEEKLSSLFDSGVRRIALSSGDFHLKSIPIKNIINVLETAQSYPEIRIHLKLIGPSSTRIKKRLIEKYPRLPISILPLIPRGKAEYLPEDNLALNVNIDTQSRCSDVCRPFIGYDGIVWRCCNVDDKSLEEGHMSYGKFLAGGIPNLAEDKLRRVLFLIGPTGLLRWLRESGFDTGNLEKHSFSYTCHLCCELLNSPDLFVPIAALISSPSLEKELIEIESRLALNAGLDKMLDGRRPTPCHT